jgi:hypothetical protein
MPAFREPQWDEERTSRSSFHFGSDPPIPESGNPLNLLAPGDRLIYLGKAFRVPMSDVVRALRISRETAYQRLRKVRAVVEAKPGPRCTCGTPRPAGRAHCEACWRKQMQNRGRAAGNARAEVSGDGLGA